MKQLLFGYIQKAIGWFMPLIMRRSLRKGLHAIYQRGYWNNLPKEGIILAANHPSWWDMYVCWFMGQQLSRPLSGVFRDETLKTFPFFRSIGGIGHSEIREALRRIQQGHILLIFPSGDMQQGGLKYSHEGVAFLAEKSCAPVYPLALRVVMRGAQKPEVFMVLGERLEPSPTRQDLLLKMENAVNNLLVQLEQQILQTHPEAKPEGFESWLAPPLRFDQKIARWQAFWK